MKVVVVIALLMLTLFGGLLAWGYWHASTHAYLDVQIHDVGLASERQRYGSPHHATLELFDGRRSPLAVARTVEPQGYLTVPHPALGDCSAFEAAGDSGYSDCHSEYSRWTSRWAGRARTATFKAGDCILKDVPVNLTRSKSGWERWWIPMRHIGGVPYEYIKLEIDVDSRSCTRAGQTLPDPA